MAISLTDVSIDVANEVWNPDFTPVILKTFNGGVVGQSASAEFDSGGSGAVYADEFSDDSSTYINSTTLINNSNTFTFGGYLNMPTPLVEGNEFWVKVSIRPSEAFWTDSSPHLKFLRLREETALGANSGYNDIYLEDTTGEIKFIKEGVNSWQYANTGTPVLNQWNDYEFYLKLHSNPLLGHVTVWKDNVRILDVDTQTMNNSDGVNNQFLLFTYWNGEPTLPSVPHTVGINNLVIATQESPPTNTDAFGNLFIGDAY